MTKEEIEQNAAAYIAAKNGKPWEWLQVWPKHKWHAPEGINIESALSTGFICRPTPPKPEPNVGPWTMETRPLGAVMVRRKETGNEWLITAWQAGAAEIGGVFFSYEKLFDLFTLQDGSPCGQLIQP